MEMRQEEGEKLSEERKEKETYLAPLTTLCRALVFVLPSQFTYFTFSESSLSYLCCCCIFSEVFIFNGLGGEREAVDGLWRSSTTETCFCFCFF